GSQVAGVLVGIDCAEGQRVQKGAVLFRLDSRVAKVTVEKARQNLEFARKTYERQKELLPVEGTSRRAYLDAEQRLDAARNDLDAAETHLALLRITAPLSGTVVRIDARLGQSVDAATVLARMIDYRRLVVTAGVPSGEAALLKPGQRVEIGEPGASGGDAPLPGTLIFVGRDVDPATDTVVVRASLPESGGLDPGRFLPIRIVAEERRDRLVVPVDSLVTRAGEGTWIVRVEGDRAIRTPVTAGLRDGGLVEVEGEGLKEGMQIVTDDAYSLPAETTIRVTGP
ncbi:MAG TPA: efflux RND transporter periplasmic adaptor subunit, partial [Candidatus Polarisedimenticolia bacterium]|nr:efflux RND transporter periplasmic adaptor subunit [Candidatus Polarisedimenticolia bacterium]